MAIRSRVSLRGGETVLKLVVKKRSIAYFTFVNGMVCKSYIVKTITNTRIHKQEDTPLLPTHSQDTLQPRLIHTRVSPTRCPLKAAS